MGGLGNQLFQFANAFALGKENNLDIVAETKYAFFSNIKFKRKYRLNKIIYNIKTLNFFNQIKIILFTLLKKFKITNKIILINEIDHKKYNKVKNIYGYHNNIILGYWQTEKYFFKYAKEINKEINLPLKGSNQFNKFISSIKKTNSVAICIRVYEELPGDKSFVGGEEDINFYNKAINYILKNLSKPKFYIFSQKKYPIIKKLDLPKNVNYVLSEDCNFDEIYNLSLISQCKSHIISNSSYFWWGAWISEINNRSKLIVSSKKFSNKDAIPSRWKRI